MDENLWNDVIIAGQGAANAISNLAGNIGEYKAQKEANASRERIARETNEANAAENEKNREFEREMWKKKTEFESPSNVRAMLEAAGINPYSAYGQQVNTPSSGTPHSNPMVGYDFETQNALAKGLKDMANFSVNQTRQMAAARKDNAEATSVNIANVEYANRLAEQLRSQGLMNEAQKIDNEKNAALNPLIIEGQNLTNEHTINLNRLADIQYQMQKFDLDWLKPSEYFKLQEDINLLLQKQLSEQELREHWRRQDRNGQISALAQSVIANEERKRTPAINSERYAHVKYYDALTKKEEQMTVNLQTIDALNNLAKQMKTTENDIYQEYARFDAWFNFNIKQNASSISDYDVRIRYQQYLMNQKHLNWFDANQAANMVSKFIPLARSNNSSQGGNAVWDNYGNQNTVNPVGPKNSEGMIPYGNGVYEDSRGWIYDAQSGQWLNPLK